ncbi:MAG: choice-of-anchor B family protein, partial [Candidatus Hydrogenedentales bacterium]
SFAHQGWLSDDRRFFYLNDEFDELNEGVPTSTYVFDVQDLNNPKHIATFGSGLGSTDHNLMVKGQFVYEANYSSGLRIFHARTPYNVTEVGWIDTYPAHDNVGFIGAWGIYPMLPSGTILVSDITNGLFILDAHAAHASVPPLPALNLPAAVLLTLLGLVGGMFTCRRIFATIR